MHSIPTSSLFSAKMITHFGRPEEEVLQTPVEYVLTLQDRLERVHGFALAHLLEMSAKMKDRIANVIKILRKCCLIRWGPVTKNMAPVKSGPPGPKMSVCPEQIRSP
ncbi:MAG: hypothetical protein A6F71_10385 [Cycloclasticus sp. symbiont of Poecilosclerida sp. M]|nr:MAG: hypothetical protein A6F71_10385 [Cycloclasticus sp. symbiont of Poecilosclerida sp. M]